MRQESTKRTDVEKVFDIVFHANGKIVGRTRLQKITYLLELVGLGEGFRFAYKHFGPYSEELTLAARKADLLGAVHEEELVASWGGTYSIFTCDKSAFAGQMNEMKYRFVCEAAAADPIELELAATAAFLACEEGVGEPWRETEKRKPSKATSGRIDNAKRLYGRLAALSTPKRLPHII